MAQTLRYIEPANVRATLPAGAAHLRIEIADEQTVLQAQVKRVFPLSEPNRYLQIQDGAGKEVGLLRTIEGLDPQTRELIEAQLDRRYFTPRIQQIEALKLDAGMWKFTVLTQRGPAEFFVRNWRDSAHEIAPNRWHIQSVDGGRFEITDLEALDVISRRLMDQLL
jgi:hypothetical protein